MASKPRNEVAAAASVYDRDATTRIVTEEARSTAVSERPVLPGDFNEIDHKVLRAQTRIFGEDLCHAFIELPLLLRFAPGAQGDLHEHHAVGALNTKILRVVD